MNSVCKYKFLVIDDIDLMEIHNLERKVNQAVKHPEPVVRLDAPWDQLERDQQNARWSDLITHRSDVPADGRPPVWKNQTKLYNNVAKQPRQNNPSWESGFLTIEEGEHGENED